MQPAAEFSAEFWTVSHLPVSIRKENFRILTLNTVTEPCNLSHVLHFFLLSVMSWLGSVIFQVIPRFIWGPVRSSWVCVLECKTLKLKERTLSFYHCHCPNTYESFCTRPRLLSGLNGYKTIKDRNCKPFFYGHFLCTLTFSYLFNNKCNCVCFVLGCFLCQRD